MSFHKLAKAKDKRFWSVRVSTDLRLIVHRTADSLLLCYVDHHDKAYAWAECRKLETHPATGAAQLVEIRERVQEVVVPAYVQPPPARAPKKPLFVVGRWLAERAATRARDHLLVTGVNPASEFLDDLRGSTPTGSTPAAQTPAAPAGRRSPS